MEVNQLLNFGNQKNSGQTIDNQYSIIIITGTILEEIFIRNKLNL